MKRKIRASKAILAGMVNTLLKRIEIGIVNENDMTERLMVYITPSIRFNYNTSWCEEHLLDGNWVKPILQPRNRLDVIEGIKAFNNMFLDDETEKGVVIITTSDIEVKREEFYPVG